ncbi:hypothetical protein AAY81_09075 [Denitrobacterium detoxificans]|uniref:4Fe-4S dicluster domain-containing protein n=1 Tax=Denitrobacterium detoxificans TaxID=79604 RepID=A0A172RZZ8_9ACTN|nr:4Fe-4S binding protein [Denitrobacterium detoxificans]ANE23225.1 hypothetical protein AAY81_09075 [Denitrobacterium detoxificans]SEO36723.1 4Fe-4S dicluster domain-containing protein [Denitrobacterium detoxificans]
MEESEKKRLGLDRRDFVRGAALGAMGMMPIFELLGCSSPKSQEAKSEKPESAQAAETSTSGEWIDPSKSDELMQKVLTETEVTSDLVCDDGTVIPAVYVRMRNRINRIGRGIGSIPNDSHSWDMIMYLWSEEDAENYLKMPLHEYFTAGDYAHAADIDEDKALAILEDQAKRNLIWRVRRGGLPLFILMPYINGFWEFNELDALYHKDMGKVAEFDMLGIKGVDPNGESGFDNTFPLFRSYPVSVDVVQGDKLAEGHDWRALIKRNPKITVSECQCRTMWKALGVPWDESHPTRTCLSLGEMAEYFIENDIGEQITQDEAIAIVEDAIDHHMVVESVCAKDADIICCCHSKSCGNLMAYRGINGEAACSTYYSAYLLKYDKDKCMKCGKCVEICPMQSITQDSDGTCVMDKACVRCGQCARVCPASARVLTENPTYPDLPIDYVDCNKYFAKDRMARGQLVDYVG